MTNTNIYKANGEISQTKIALDNIDDLKFDNLFKISGRYLLNNNFNYDKYVNENNIFKRDINNTNSKYYFTCLYKISNNNFNNYFNKINLLFKDEKLNESYEIILPRILEYNFKEIDTLGITQNISVWKNNYDQMV